MYFRGQTELYSTLSPSLFRGTISHRSLSNRLRKLSHAISHISSKAKTFNTLHEKCKEALVQHYGLKTSWIDLVDNVWVALWFACHKVRSADKIGKFLHFEKRGQDKEPDGYAYILMIAVDADQPISPGILTGSETEFVDLRVASPSIFLRPHAQHGVLFRLRGKNIIRPSDYAAQIRGIIRIKLSDAISWLGSGEMLGVHALFPPPYYDSGYEFLLNSGYPGDNSIGSIAHIGA
ncbi:FRG domain-containing protein [Paramagnetospirillum magneticum]|uniref:FRG domain-containing protein n=1 Tax=Paramagnetospirillum magneticum TaxID=84159 RepID=UPI000A00DB4D|nr:FRG domain-containing protein [Paramagnetospirillum magneticum]